MQNLIVRLDYVDASTGIEHIYATRKISGLSVPGSNLSLHTKGARVIESNNSIPTASYSVKPINASITSLQAIQALLNDITIILTITLSLKQAVKGTDHVNITKEIPHHNLIYLHVWYIIIMSV